VTGLLIQATGLGWIAMVVGSGAAYSAVIAPLVVAGVGVSMAMPAVQNAVLSSVAVAEMDKASGVFNMGRFLGGVFGVVLLVTIFSASGATGSPEGFNSGFAAAMTVAAWRSRISVATIRFRYRSIGKPDLDRNLHAHT
jgi:hypothetical protein